MKLNTFNRIVWLCGFLAFTTVAFAQPADLSKELYKATGIADSLKENANAVIRYSSDEILIKGAGKAVLKHYKLVTILNDKADYEARFQIGYNRKYDVVNSIFMRVYNADGVLLKKYYKSDMYDGLAYDDATLVTDDRYLGIKHTIASYPITIEIGYEEDLSSFLDLGYWNIQNSETSVQTSVCKVSADPSVGFRYSCKNVKLAPQKGNKDNLETYTWQVKNLKAEKPEDDVPEWYVAKRIAFAANQFQFMGIPGDFSSWQSYGKWQSALNADVCSLPEARAEEIRKMTADLKTDKEKAKFLYKYMQQNMRYVSIQLGIGGLKPFPATFVDQKKYGDCKALTNYMYALLKAVNIPSYYAEVNAGTNKEPADPAFPYDPFNHVILCLPLKGDTTWLECTSNRQPFGKLGPFTENRRALLVTENGGMLVNTPKSSMADNVFNSETHIALNEDGSAKATVKILSTGEYRDLYMELKSNSNDDQKAFLIRSLKLKQPSVFDIKDGADENDIKEFDLALEYDKFYDMAAGDKQFYRPRVLDIWTAAIPSLEKRRSDFFFEHPLQKKCTTVIDVPAGYTVESLPVNVNLKFSYGNYDVTYAYDAAKNQVTSIANFNIINNRIPAAKYTEMQVYMDNVLKAQNKKLVIRRKAS